MSSSRAEETLSPSQRKRFVRQRLLPEVGLEGQARLCASTFRAGTSPGSAVAADYLLRAGLRPNSGAILEVDATDPVDAMIAGSFAAVEHIKAVLGAGSPGTLPEELA
ncbi:MAG: hypothetical protein AAGE52_37845 [Myxococcota bacterium]